MLVKEAIQAHDVEIYDYVDREDDIPLISRSACAGDMSILRVTTEAAVTPIPARGVVVVGVGAPGAQTGHPHALHGSGCFFDFAAERTGSLVIGTLTVPDGTTGVASHPEHGFLEIAPGTYQIGRQREYAGEWRQVAD
jgi:hypothetical protein